MKRWFKLPHASLYKKIFVWLLVSVYIPVFLLGYLSYNRYGRQLEQATSAYLSDNLTYNAQKMHGLFDEVERRSVEVYSSEDVQELLLLSKADRLQESEFIYEVGRLRLSVPRPYELSIYPADPNRYPNYNVLGHNRPQSGSDWFERALASDGRGFWVFDTVVEFGTAYSDFYFVRPIRFLRPGFENLGVMVIRVPAQAVRDSLVMTDRYAGYSVTIADTAGRDLLQPGSPPDGVVLSQLPTAETAEAFRKLELAGKEYYAETRPLRMNGWMLAATIPVADVQGPIRRVSMYTWLVLLASLAFITVLLAAITRNIALPIQIVVGYMKRVNTGLLERCGRFLTRRDEIGQLVSGYNSMIHGMEELLRATKQAEREKRRLELQMLMHQINPHFLYNTLDSIRWQAETAKERNIAEMVTSLANLLRFSLNEGEEMTTLEREIEHVKSYVSIESGRKGGFRVLYHIQPGIWNVPFMKLLLQPIVENAIRHGLRPAAGGEGKIMISVHREEGDLVCIVEDNGVGCAPDRLERLRRSLDEADPQLGLGLSNVHRRLQVGFGRSYGLQLEAKPASGLRVTLRHPLLEAKTANTP